MNSLRGHVQTQTSFSTLSDSGGSSNFEYEPDKLSLRSVLNRMSSLFHTFHLGGSGSGSNGNGAGGGGLSRHGSGRKAAARDGSSPSPSGVSVASGTSSRHSSISRKRSSAAGGGHAGTRGAASPRNSALLLDVLLPSSSGGGGGGGGGSRRSSIWSLGTLIVSAQVSRSIQSIHSTNKAKGDCIVFIYLLSKGS